MVGHGGVELVVGPDDLSSLLQPNQFYGSVSVRWLVGWDEQHLNEVSVFIVWRISFPRFLLSSNHKIKCYEDPGLVLLLLPRTKWWNSKIS